MGVDKGRLKTEHKWQNLETFGNKPGTCVYEIGVGGRLSKTVEVLTIKQMPILYIKIKYLHTINCAFKRGERQTVVRRNSLALKILMSTIYNDLLQINKKEHGKMGEALDRELRNT